MRIQGGTDLEPTTEGLKGIFDPFVRTLATHGLTLTRMRASTLQVNVGLQCNQACRHCHLEAGPHRGEMMDLATAREVSAFAERTSFDVIDITGGAPELNPNLITMLEWFAARAPQLMIRSNLSALMSQGERLVEVLAGYRVTVVASVPSLNAGQLEAQRGKGVWEQTVAGLRKLNACGYGQAETGLQLNLVCNPTGAFLPSSQAQTERRFRRDLEARWGIVFNRLFTFANVPLGRFRQWLEESGNLATYMRKLVSSFNPCTVEGLMCRNLISVSWDGYLYDCDFNQAVGLPAGGVRTHISECDGPPAEGTPIAVSEHCYACTAGSGFT